MILYGARTRHPSGRLLLVDELRYCDSKHEHEVRVITDGHRLYSAGPHTATGTASRVGSLITLTCGQPGRGDEPCDAVVELDLTEPGVWAAAVPEAAVMLADYGTEVER